MSEKRSWLMFSKIRTLIFSYHVCIYFCNWETNLNANNFAHCFRLRDCLHLLPNFSCLSVIWLHWMALWMKHPATSESLLLHLLLPPPLYSCRDIRGRLERRIPRCQQRRILHLISDRPVTEPEWNSADFQSLNPSSSAAPSRSVFMSTRKKSRLGAWSLTS